MNAFTLNGARRETDKRSLTYEELLGMAGYSFDSAASATWRDPKQGGSGILCRGRELRVTPTVIVNVCHTGAA